MLVLLDRARYTCVLLVGSVALDLPKGMIVRFVFNASRVVALLRIRVMLCSVTWASSLRLHACLQRRVVGLYILQYSSTVVPLKYIYIFRDKILYLKYKKKLVSFVLLSLIKDYSLIKATFEPLPKTHFLLVLTKNHDTIVFLIVSNLLAHNGML